MKKILLLFLWGTSVSFLDQFPEDENRVLVLQNCLLCHSASLACNQRMKKEAWNKTLLWMEKKHNLKFESEQTRSKILAYLSTYFKPEEQSEASFPMGRRPVNPLPEEGVPQKKTLK